MTSPEQTSDKLPSMFSARDQQRYLNDPIFHRLVDNLADAIANRHTCQADIVRAADMAQRLADRISLFREGT